MLTERKQQALTDALRDFQMPDDHLREAALCRLWSIGGAEAMDALTAATRDSSLSIRWRATATLGLGLDPEGLEPLLERLQCDDSEDIREGCAGALVHFDDPRVPDALAAALADDSLQGAVEAASSLVELGDPRGLTALQAWISGDDPEARSGAVMQVVSLGLPAEVQIPALQRYLREFSDRLADPNAVWAQDCLARLGPQSVTGIDPKMHRQVREARARDDLRSPDARTRQRAVSALAELAPADLEAELLRLFSDDQLSVRMSAVTWLRGKTSAVGEVEAARCLRSDAHPLIRSLCAPLLEQSKTAETREALTAALHDADWKPVAAAIDALATRQERSVAGEIVALLRHAHPLVPLHAARALVKLGEAEDETVAYLERQLGNPDQWWADRETLAQRHQSHCYARLFHRREHRVAWTDKQTVPELLAEARRQAASR